ncbi:MAG: hypothetical protein K2K59_01340, partial [Muribaculaceae bacterium]|nr:hypothetical protein [Muribaculaceae bacterium]
SPQPPSPPQPPIPDGENTIYIDPKPNGNNGNIGVTSEDTISDNKAGLYAVLAIAICVFVFWLVGSISSDSSEPNQTEAVATEVVEEAVEVVEEATEVPAYDYYY